MKHFFLAVLAMFGTLSFAQTTTPVTPTINNGQVTITVPDSSGGTHVVTFPVTAVVTLSVGAGTNVYTAPVVVPPPPVNVAPTIPPTCSATVTTGCATAVSLITSGTWKAPEHDAGTPGTGSGTNNYPVVGPLSNSDREFSMTYTAAGGVRWANSFATDPTSTNFVLDAIVESPDWTHTADLELDTNQVKSDGNTTILGMECASQSKTWEYTLATNGVWHWVVSNVTCNPLTWTPNVPHHIRIFGTISASDISTYLGVELDGVYSPFSGATGSTADSLGWTKGVLLDNVQIDGFGASGSATVYMDQLTVYRW